MSRQNSRNMASLSFVVMGLLLWTSTTQAFSAVRGTLSTPFSRQPAAFSPIVKPCSSCLYQSMSPDDAPSDYDMTDLAEPGKSVAVDTKDEDAIIRDALKRELLLLASVTNRGQCATKGEKDIMIDLITQLEALNPSADPALHCEGEWDLCLASTYAFVSSPFFQTIRSALSNIDNGQVARNGFAVHDRATTAGTMGRVRQTIVNKSKTPAKESMDTEDMSEEDLAADALQNSSFSSSFNDNDIGERELISEVDLQVGILPGLPFRIEGTVKTTATFTTVLPETWKLTIKETKVVGSNVPVLNNILGNDSNVVPALPVGQIYQQVTGEVPVVEWKTFYVDESIRIVRDVDDNYFVFVRA